MKTRKSLPVYFLLFIITVLTSISSAQELWPLNYDSGNIFSNTNNSQLLEFWEGTPKPVLDLWYVISLHITNKDKLVVNSSRGEKAIFDSNADNTAYIKNLNTDELMIRNNTIYTVKKYNQNWQEEQDGNVKLFQFNDRFGLVGSHDLKGVSSQYYLGKFTIARNGRIYLSAYLTDDEGYYYGFVVYVFDKEGKPENQFPLPQEAQNFRSLETDGLGNLVILPYSINQKVLIINPKGKTISSFDIPVNGSASFTSDIKLSESDTFLFSFGGTTEILETDNRGRKINSVYLDFPGFPPYTLIAVVRDSKGHYFVAHGGYNAAEISEFDSQGSYLKPVYPAPETDSNCEEERPKRAAGLFNICQGPEDSLLGIDAAEMAVRRVSMDGEILGSFPLSAYRSRPDRILMDSKERILLLYENGIDIYNIKGEFQRSYLSPDGKYNFDRAVDFALDQEDNIYILRAKFHDETHHVVILNSKGKPVGQIVKNDPDPYGGKETEDMAIDKDGNILIIWEDSSVKVYNKKGKKVDEILGAPFCDRIYTGPGGNIYMHSSFSEGFVITAPDKTRLAYTNDFTVSCIFEGSNGRLYLGGWDRTVVLNNLQRHYWRGEVAEVSGTLRAVKSPLIEADLYKSYVCLEGTDPLGNDFQAVYAGPWSGNSFKFKGIPLGSKVRIWINDYQTDLMKFKKPIASFTVKKTSQRRNFQVTPIPANYVLVRGRVLKENGSPIPGALVSSGKEKAVTGLDGSYCLSVPARKKQLISVEKTGITFKQQSQTVRVKDAHLLDVNFVSK